MSIPENVSPSLLSLFFSWEAFSPAPKNIVYNLLLPKDREFNKPIIRKNIAFPKGTLPEAEILNLQVGIRYYWKVAARVSSRAVASSPVRFFQTGPVPPGWTHVPGMCNVGNVGGWPLG